MRVKAAEKHCLFSAWRIRARMGCQKHGYLRSIVTAWQLFVLQAILLKQTVFTSWKAFTKLYVRAMHRAEQSVQSTARIQQETCCWFVFFTWQLCVQDAHKHAQVEQCCSRGKRRAEQVLRSK